MIREYKKFNSTDLLVATHNTGKLKEFAELLQPHKIHAVSMAELKLPEPEETGATFIENATIKAVAASKISGLPALADDSGLSVEALSGAPGIYSARWAGPSRNFDTAMRKVIDAMADFESSKAHFVCALALSWPDGSLETFGGYVYGKITWPPRGNNGFGYDPIFIPNGETRTFSEMSPSEKDRISHRSDAFGKLVKFCFNDRKT